MVRNCCVIGCSVRSHDRQGNKLGNGLSFHSFPTWKRLAWIAAVGRVDLQFSSISKYLLVCSRHFHSDIFVSSSGKRCLQPKVVPSYLHRMQVRCTVASMK
uniref:THAP domain-containing protein 1 n=1 Tax=Oreochromis niloticus TaxID=8128 RepID=A0A669ELG1_ORENI